MSEEEKKEKKATPFFFSKKTGAKKESFTFSDKIKNSKQPSKSFANRASSKVGSDGKPRQTLFERTKRDAPFFIAALVALLLLPFLYKYSGNADEEPTLITPGYEDSAFNPDRSGFDGFAGNPEEQIAQLSGRDSLSLIRPFGGKKVEEEEETYVDDYPETRAGFEGGSNSLSGSREVVDEDTLNENIYIHRKQARPATRAAFKRAATAINRLSPTGRTGASGGKLGVGMWGGSLKSAANKVRGHSPTSSPKPVSLQPLQAAGKPSRSYFGQGAAREAARSKDALSKSNPLQALMDAQMKPVEPGKIGGMLSGDFGGPGGGTGDLKREFNFSGKEPWWWDMMKQRSQMEWEAKFKRKWSWINWGDKLAQNILGGIINCLLTGEDDGSMGSMFGKGVGSGRASKCCGMKRKAFEAVAPTVGLSADWSEDNCKSYRDILRSKDPNACPGSWEGGSETSTRKGFFGARLGCLGIAGSKYGDKAGLGVDSGGAGQCDKFVSTHEYLMVPEGLARKWHTYHYVTARNYMPETLKKIGVGGKYLCTPASDHLQMERHLSSGVSQTYKPDYAKFKKEKPEGNWAQYLLDMYGLNNNAEAKQELEAKQKKLNVARQTTDDQRTVGNLRVEAEEAEKRIAEDMVGIVMNYANQGRQRTSERQNLMGDIYSVNPESREHSCVVYLAQGNQFSYDQFQTTVVTALKELIMEQDSKSNKLDEDQALGLAKQAFGEMDFFFIEGVSMKKKLGYAKWGATGNEIPLPMLYSRFYNAYIVHRGTTASETGSRNNVANRRYRMEEEEYVMSEPCNFDMDVHLECIDNSAPATALLKKGKVSSSPVSDIKITANFKPITPKEFKVPEEKFTLAQSAAPKTYTYEYKALDTQVASIASTDGAQGVEGTVQWKATYQRNGTPFTQQKDCPFSTISEPAPEDPGCKDGETRTDADGCELKCKDRVWTKVDPECPRPHRTPETPEEDSGDEPPLVEFYTTFTSMTKDPLNDGDNGRPQLKENTEPKQWDSCKIDDLSTALLDYDGDNETQEYMKQATVAYSTAMPSGKTTKEMRVYGEPYENQGQVSNKHPTLAQTVDAMRISQALGITNVPKNTVCAVARTIGLASKDPHDNQHTNMFGAFAAYIDVDSSFFPTMRVTDTNGRSGIDRRFHGCHDRTTTNQNVLAPVGQRMQADTENQAGKGCGETRNSGARGQNECTAFHYGHYNWNEKKIGDLAPGPNCVDRSGKKCLQDDRKPYIDMITNVRKGIWGNFPLQELAHKKGKQIFVRAEGPVARALTRNGTIDSYNRTRYHTAYRRIFHVSGQSCGYDSSDTMPVADALEYIDNLCKNGIRNKPSNGARIPCDHYYRADYGGR